MDFRALVENAPVLADGAWGTELQARGLPPGECPDGWNLTNPSEVLEVARSYVAAGSQVILTNTFRANALSLAGFGLDASAREINRTGAAISREAASGRAVVFGSIGPVGEMLAINEDLRDRMTAAFEEQASALAEGGVDAILLETMMDIEEAGIAVACARRTGLPVLVSFAFDTGRNKDRTMTGATPEQAAHAMEAAGVDGVGANCGIGIESAIGICRRLRAATELPLWLKPNAGLPKIQQDRVIYDVSPEDFALRIPSLIEAGATFVGACCGSGPAFIAAAAAQLRKATAKAH